MKTRYTLSTLLTLLTATLSIAQWSSGSGLIYYNGGKVGIGTSSPSYMLTIKSNDENHLRFNNGNESAFFRLIDSGNLEIWSHGDDDIIFKKGTGSGIETVRIAYSGNVGIGTSSPEQLLHLKSSDPKFQIERTGSIKWQTRIDNAGKFVVQDATNSTEPLRIEAGANSYSLHIKNNGSIGIGTSSPSAKLQVVNDGSNGSGGLGDLGIVSVANSGQATIGAEKVGDGYANLNLGTNESGTRRFWHISKRAASTAHALQFYYYDGTSFGNPKITFATDGNVGIGTSSPDSKLAVKGNVHAEEVIVDLNVPGPDYVFEENYELMSLEEIEAFISKNKHLPEIPTAEEMAENGLKVGEMNMLLLKKIEELTLHAIKQQKTIAELQIIVEILSNDRN